MGNWTPWLRITADKERRDDIRTVSATPLSLVASNNSYDVPTYSPDTSWVTSAIGVNGYFGPNWSVSVAYTRIDSRSNVKEDGISGIVSYRF